MNCEHTCESCLSRNPYSGVCCSPRSPYYGMYVSVQHAPCEAFRDMFAEPKSLDEEFGEEAFRWIVQNAP